MVCRIQALEVSRRFLQFPWAGQVLRWLAGEAREGGALHHQREVIPPGGISCP